jgi:hypothetical protein
MRCAQCGEDHDTTAIELSFSLPDEAAVLSWTNPDRVHVAGDICVIDAARYFLRAILPLPVIGRQRPYRIGLWVALSRDDCARVHELWSDPRQIDTPPIPVRIANEIPIAVGTAGASADLHLTGPTTRPSAMLRPARLLLHDEQTHGITAHRAYEYSRLVMADEDVDDAKE